MTKMCLNNAPGLLFLYSAHTRKVNIAVTGGRMQMTPPLWG